MTDRVVVNRDRTALLPPNSPQKGYYITRKEAVELGLLDSAEKLIQTRRVSTETHATASEPVRKLQRRRSKRK